MKASSRTKSHVTAECLQSKRRLLKLHMFSMGRILKEFINVHT